MVPNKTINPAHYKNTINGQEIQVVDVMEAFFLTDAHLSQACKYLLRAGRKADSSYIQDVGKALWWCARAILHRKGTIDLPPGAEKQLTVNGVSIPIKVKT